MARVAIIVDDQFEDSEFKEPYDRLRKAGHEVLVVGLQAGKQLQGKRRKVRKKTDVDASAVSVDELDALVIPGGYSPDHLRTDARMVAITREMVASGKPVAVVCHGPWMLAEADVARGRTLTSWPSIKTDLVNAGARWVDEEVVEDGNLITSRRPSDLPAFCDALLRQLERREAAREPSAQPATERTEGAP